MPLLYSNRNFRADIIGMPDAHAEQFKTVAERQRCVIVCRAVGPTCRQLLEQGYDTKGFRIHGKSCDWGPMAGFVLRDPRLNKAGMGKVDFNRHAHQVSFQDSDGAGWRAGTVPLKIYEARRVWLVEKGLIRIVRKGERWEGTATHPTGISFDYCLIRDPARADVWGVYFDTVKNNTRGIAGFRQERGTAVVRYDTKYGSMYEPMLAVTNPADHRSWRGDDFRNAVTGDYDLMAIWPFVRDYDHDGEDRRVLGTARAFSQAHHIEHVMERNFTTEGQGTKIGNITNRIYMVCQVLNSCIGGTRSGNFGPFPNRNVCWHSDEAARPGVDDLDVPCIAFSPSRSEIGITTIDDFKLFITRCQNEHVKVSVAEGWTLAPTAEKPKRLGTDYQRLIPEWMGGQWPQRPSYNR